MTVKKNVKVTTSISREVWQSLKILAVLKDVSMQTYLKELIEKHITKNSDKLGPQREEKKE
ncbi:MAG TPA: hypothetical protein VKR58_08365 [Aquella sp.]|nr:hypothetical protein [Aquella sp.]